MGSLLVVFTANLEPIDAYELIYFACICQLSPRIDSLASSALSLYASMGAFGNFTAGQQPIPQCPTENTGPVSNTGHDKICAVKFNMIK